MRGEERKCPHNLFLTTEGPNFETWISKDGNFTKADVMPAEPPASFVGQSSFVDFGSCCQHNQMAARDEVR
ncbi:T-cell immunomodulatory protein [Lates japonicus]|uniref:T-cell immunomodulatory protein n=1 Tax=Lates japonicus TaxID=270547 RepID=A0AAD3N9W6_LATJO|nr:T-cell immunomodulatory protein [Lates japonicus]